MRRPALQRGDGDDAGLASRTMDVAQALDERTRRARCAAIPHFGSAATQRRRRWADRGGEGKCMTVGMGLEAAWAGEGEGGWRVEAPSAAAKKALRGRTLPARVIGRQITLLRTDLSETLFCPRPDFPQMTASFLLLVPPCLLWPPVSSSGDDGRFAPPIHGNDPSLHPLDAANLAVLWCLPRRRARPFAGAASPAYH